ncbi:MULTISPECIES: recombinase family protein [Hyphobacterium]|uniref:Recombinase family protein n=1 Tax=Hyphobacterium vulgare TaxID=1736751 RepID=A0ABV7A1A0_9PROT
MRKSREEGLEQSFNSLDAQAEACANFIASQRHEGWVVMDEEFRDPGFSAGTLDRPALRRLLKRIERDEIDVVVVYKLDRLSRSITDFAKLTDVFAAHDVAIVSVTQSINTSDAMGKLLLNVLMSFAQFERENTAERIRDKVAASKRRGLWMGGVVPYGYQSRKGALSKKPHEAAVVEHLFKRFIALGSVQRLSDETAANDEIPTFSKSRLHKMLKNPIYRGQIRHRDELHDGVHKAIIDEATWSKAAAILATNTYRRAGRTRAKTPALLKGLLFGPDGAPMSPTHTRKGQKLYRYYVSQTVLQKGAGACEIGRVSADEIEALVLDRIKHVLAEPEIIASVEHALVEAGVAKRFDDLPALVQELTLIWENLMPEEQGRLVALLVDRVTIGSDQVEVVLRIDGIHQLCSQTQLAA